jgi:hypothetical protein
VLNPTVSITSFPDKMSALLLDSDAIAHTHALRNWIGHVMA